jgi:hypothetical protein
MRLQTIIILGLTLIGFFLRLYYLISTHPFFDEYTTVLAARQILQHGWPILPSGLFYEHGLLATYVIVPFTALFINLPISEWQPGHWALMLARWPSVLVGTVTIPLIFAIGRQCLTGSTRSGAALLAAGLFALSPEGMVWGGRARMYALATLLVLLTVYLTYRGTLHPALAKFRWAALLTLLAALLSQFGVLMFVPPLVVGMIVIGWLSSRAAARAQRPWFLRPTTLFEGATLAGVVGIAIWVKRLGRPLGAAALGSPQSSDFVTELVNTITYQTAFHFTWPDTVKFIARQFGVPHHFWLTILTIIGASLGLVVWLIERNRSKNLVKPYFFYLFLWLVFGLVILEMVTLLEPFRRNPRYIVMYLPLFYLITGNAIFNFRLLPRFRSGLSANPFRPQPAASRPTVSVVAAIILLFVFTILGYNDLRVALLTPEPAYEEAFAWIEANRQPGDTLLTMNTPAAGLYLGQADGFTVQDNAEQFLIDANTSPVDRWLGVPWLGNAADFKNALNSSEQAWFVIDTIRQSVYFRGDWLAVVDSQMEQVWAKDNALIYRTRPDRVPISSQPKVAINATLNDAIELVGYTLEPTHQSANSQLKLTLFWEPLRSLPSDYTTFVHLRNGDGVTVAQRDTQPLNGAYPTSRWQPGETVIDLILLSLPADLPFGRYQLVVGMYQLDTRERLTVTNDTSGENAIFLGEVTVP